jgi:hypothetical protein
MKYIIPAFVLFLGIVATSTLSNAKPEYTKKEKKACTFCHVSGKSKELNEAGKYYRDHDKLGAIKKGRYRRAALDAASA